MKKEQKSSLIKGAVVLSIVGFLLKAMSAVFKIGLVNIVGSEGVGIYGLVFSLFGFCVILVSDGISLGLTIKISKNQDSAIQESYKKFALKLVGIIAILIALVVVLFSKVISKFQGGCVSDKTYFFVAILTIIVAFLSYYKAILRGYEDYSIYSLCEIIEESFKIGLGLVLAKILLSKGENLAIGGVFVAIMLGSVVSLVVAFCGISKYKKNKPQFVPILSNAQKIEFVKFSVIQTVSSLIVPIIQLLDSGLVVNLLLSSGATSVVATKLYGLSRGSVSAILNLPNFILVAFEFLLVPHFSSLNSKERKKNATVAISIAMFVGSAFTIFYCLFSKEIISILYSKALNEEELSIASSLLKIGSVSLIFLTLSQIIVVLFEAEAKPTVPLIGVILGGIIKILLLFVLIPRVSIFGAEIASVAFVMIDCLVVTIVAVKNKLFYRPTRTVFIFLFWIIFCVIVKFLYLLLYENLGQVASFVVALFGVSFFCLFLLFILCIKTKKSVVQFVKTILYGE